MNEPVCQTCHKNDEVAIEGEFPKFYAWCYDCNYYVDFDAQTYTENYLSDMIDSAEMAVEDR